MIPPRAAAGGSSVRRPREAPGGASGRAPLSGRAPILGALLLAALCAAPATAEAGLPPDGPRMLDGGRPGALDEGQEPSEAEPLRLGSVSADEAAARESAREAVGRGLDWLTLQLEDSIDGSFPKGDAEQNAPVAVTSLGALAFMAAGTTVDRGPHGRALARAIDYLLSRADLTPGSPRFGYIGSEGDKLSRMHGHGFATLALAEAWTVSPRTERGRRIGEALRAAVGLIERTQGAEGGWNYEPRREIDHEGSITICLVQALRAAHAAGIQVDTEVVARAESYVDRSQNENGSFRYALNIDRSSIALTAAALSTLNAAGRYQGPSIDRGTDALWRALRQREEGEGERAQFPFYERLYLAQAFWQHHEAQHFERWWPGARAEVLADQRPDGSWRSREYGPCYATAMNCLVLALPEAVLPIFQR